MQRSSWDADVEWFIRCGAAALGERGIAGSLIEMLKHGIPNNGGVPCTDLYSDQQIGWGARGGEGTIARARRCAAVFARLSPWHQQVLAGRYDARQWAPGVAGALGDLAGVVVVMVATRNSSKRRLLANRALAEHELELEAAREDGSPGPLLEALTVHAQIEASAQRGVIPSDYQEVADSCQSGNRKAAAKRARWRVAAESQLSKAHAAWRREKKRLVNEWAA